MGARVMSCAELDCDGVIDDDGYCSTCGTKAKGAVGSSPTSPQKRTSGRTTKVTRARLGAGLVEIAPTPSQDPRSALIADPRIREDRRFCSNSTCGKPVGRARDGEPGRTEGFCPGCGRPYSFRPQLAAGDLVAGPNAIGGCIAPGGVGGEYLGSVSERRPRWGGGKGPLD